MKCNLLKQKFRPDYEEKLEKTLKEEQILKEVRSFILGSKKTVTTFEEDDIAILTYDETIKAIKSIQSKKYHTRWLTDEEGNNDEFRHACKIEELLKDHLKDVKPIEDNVVKKSDIMNVIDLIEQQDKISKQKVLEMLKELV